MSYKNQSNRLDLAYLLVIEVVPMTRSVAILSSILNRNVRSTRIPHTRTIETQLAAACEPVGIRHRPRVDSDVVQQQSEDVSLSLSDLLGSGFECNRCCLILTKPDTTFRPNAGTCHRTLSAVKRDKTRRLIATTNESSVRPLVSVRLTRSVDQSRCRSGCSLESVSSGRLYSHIVDVLYTALRPARSGF
jgi:hypothetical protein